jgi:signal transduction histidine kinase
MPSLTEAELSVADNGHGIDEEILDRIFEPFFSTKDSDEGTGLGLSVVRGIVEGHQGTISVESVVGEGTTFRIRLPLGSPGPES